MKIIFISKFKSTFFHTYSVDSAPGFSPVKMCCVSGF